MMRLLSYANSIYFVTYTAANAEEQYDYYVKKVYFLIFNGVLHEISFIFGSMCVVHMKLFLSLSLLLKYAQL